MEQKRQKNIPNSNYYRQFFWPQRGESAKSREVSQSSPDKSPWDKTNQDAAQTDFYADSEILSDDKKTGGYSFGDPDDFLKELHTKNTYMDQNGTDYTSDVRTAISMVQGTVDFIRTLPREFPDETVEFTKRAMFETALRTLNNIIPRDVRPLEHLISSDLALVKKEISKAEKQFLKANGDETLQKQTTETIATLKKAMTVLKMELPLYAVIKEEKSNSPALNTKEQMILKGMNFSTLKKDSLRVIYNWWDRVIESASVTLVEKMMVDTSHENWKMTNHIDKKASPQDIVRCEINKWFYTHPFFEGVDTELQDCVISSIKKVSPDFTRLVLHFDPDYQQPATVSMEGVSA
jgi:hypothetical protein